MSTNVLDDLAALQEQAETHYRDAVTATARGEAPPAERIRALLANADKNLADFQIDVERLQVRLLAVDRLRSAEGMTRKINALGKQQNTLRAKLTEVQQEAARMIEEAARPWREVLQELATLCEEQTTAKAEAGKVLCKTADPVIEAELVRLYEKRSAVRDMLLLAEHRPTSVIEGEIAKAEESADDLESRGYVMQASATRDRLGALRKELTKAQQDESLCTDPRAQLADMEKQIAELESEKLNPERLAWTKG